MDLRTLVKPIFLKHRGVAFGLWGDAGIGKSYQVAQLIHGLSCRSTGFHATTPFATFSQALPRPKILARWATHNLNCSANGETVENNALIDSLGAVLAGLAPFVFYLEDIHEATSERIEFIQRLARVVLQIKGVALIVTSRMSPPKPFSPIKLEPLSYVDANVLLVQELKATIPEDALKWIYTQAAGNPLYSLEYLRFLSRQGFLWSDGNSWHWRIPEHTVMPVTVEALIEQRLTQANSNPLHRIVLETRALLPSTPINTLWGKVAQVGPLELESAVAELENQGVFQGNTFAHPLFREVMLNTMGKAKKRDLSRRAITSLADQPEQAALYVDDAGLTHEQTLEILIRAAEQTRERNLVQAARFLGKAAEYATGEERASLAYKASYDLYEYDLTLAIRLLKLAHHTRPGDFEILTRLVMYLAQAGNRSEVERFLKKLSPTEQISIRGLTLSIRVAQYLRDYTRVVDLWDTHPQLHSAASPTTIRDVAFSRADLGDATGALKLASGVLEQTVISIEERVILLEACGFACYAQSDFSAAVNYYTQAIDLFRQNSETLRTGSLLFNRAIALQNLARFSESLVDAQEALQLAADSGHALFYANAQLALAACRLERGEYPLAEKLFLECEDYYRRSEMTPWLVDVYIGLSDLYLAWQTPYAGILARKHGEKALSLARGLNNPRYIIGAMPYCARAEAIFGDPHHALTLAEEGYRLSHAQSDMVTFARNLRARASALNKLGRNQEAHIDLQKALGIMQQMNAPLDHAKINLELDRLNNNQESAREHLKWFEERDLMNGANIARRYFPELEQKAIAPKLTESSVRLEVLGSMQVFTNGEIKTVRGRKRKELFAWLLEARLAGRSQLSQLDLADKLYPDNPDEKLESIKQLVFQVRSTFGQTVIATSGNGYALGVPSSDAEIFLENGDTSLWYGDYLEGVDNHDDIVSGALHHALNTRVKAMLETDPQEAARVGRILVKAEPYELESWRLTLKAVQQSGTLQSLEKLYREGCKRMAEVNEILPEDWEIFLNHEATPNI